MVFPDKKIIFLLPPKCGTSSFCYLLKFLTKINFIENTPRRHSLLSENVDYCKIKNLQDYKIYQLCRHPLDKLISSYYYFRPKFKLHSPEAKPLPGLWQYNFNDYLKLVLPHLHLLTLNSNTFLKTIHKELYKHHERKFGSAMLHFTPLFYQPQTNWNDLNVDIEYIKLEDLVEDTFNLSLILKEDIPHKFPNKNKNNKKPPKSYLEIYTEETLELTYKAYKKDFEILGYN